MRKIYLIRHAKPLFPNGVTVCIGKTDLPLSPEGEEHAKRLGEFMRRFDFSSVWHSGLVRSRETARIAFGDSFALRCSPLLQELDFGEWEGLSFDDVKERYPEYYEKRGKDLYLMPPGSEPRETGAKRLNAALRSILNETEGNAAAVTHSAINRSFLCTLGLKEPVFQPYCCINVLEFDGEFRLCEQINVE